VRDSVQASTDQLGTPVHRNYQDDMRMGAFLDAQPMPVADGNGIGVAVIDSGIEPGEDFNDRITAFYDFTNGDILSVAPSDAYGHGTHVAGLIASQYVGVAPNARLIGLKVLDVHGKGW